MGIPVEAVPVAMQSMAQQLSTVGTLRANESVVVRPEIAGRIARIGFNEGQKVSRGQLLIKLDSSNQVSALEEAKANLTLSQANFDRAVRLLKQGAATEKARDEAESKFLIDQAKLETAKTNLEKTQIIAPFEGVVGLRNVSLGAYVSPGEEIVQLQSLDPLKVDFRLPEVNLGLLHSGQSVLLSSDAFPKMTFTGDIYAIDPVVDANGRSVVARARVPNPEGRLKPGMFVRVEVQVGDTAPSLLIPEEALVPRGHDVFVFRVSDGKVSSVKVAIGSRRLGMAQITEGLAEGDVIVTAGQMKLRDGAPVMVMPNPGSPPNAGGAPAPGR